MAAVLILVWGIAASVMAGFVILSVNTHVYLAGMAIAIIALVVSIASLLTRRYKLAFAFACSPAILTAIGFAVLTALYG
jgi:hypothetical protein